MTTAVDLDRISADLRVSPSLALPLRLLAHPTVVAAIGFLAINDHVLRRSHPSIITGKLSDFLWLFFFPAVLAALFSLLSPARAHSHAGEILLTSMGITGVVFGLAKTLHPFRSVLVEVISLATGIEVSITQDPTDLVAVLSFLPLWMISTKVGEQAKRETWAMPYVVIVAGAMLSLANSAAANYGIACLSTNESEVQASGSVPSDVFVSRDGGLTWADCSECARTCQASSQETGLVLHQEKPAVLFHYVAGEFIERSEDAGRTWIGRFDLGEAHEATTALYSFRAARSSIVLSDGPLAAMIDPRTGNGVFAMGHDGILVYVALTGEWEWVGVGGYERISTSVPASPREALDFLYGEVRLSILLGLLAVATIVITAPNRAVKYITLILPWTAFFAAWGFGPASTRDSYSQLIAIFLTFAGYLAGFVHLLLFSRNQLKLSRLRWQFGVFLVAVIVFILPYLLWSYTLLPTYFGASLLSSAAGLAVITGGRITYQRAVLSVQNPRLSR